jgi:hypothetical protein
MMLVITSSIRRSGDKHMPVKVKIVSSKPTPVAVRVRRPEWQQFLHY